LCVLYYEPAWAYGGPPRMVFDLARSLAARQHDVTVCTTDALDETSRVLQREQTSQGVRIVRFPNVSNWLAYHLKIFLPRGMKSWLAAHVRDFDVVHLFDARTMPNAWASLEAVRHGVPFFLSAWGSLPQGAGWRSMVKGSFDRKHLQRQLSGARALLAQNQHETQVYAEYGADRNRIRLWPLGVNPTDFENLPPSGVLRRRLGISESDQVVLFVGRIHILKGLDTLIRAFASAQRSIAASLVVVGRDDGYASDAKALAQQLGIASRCHFPGGLYGSDALPAYVDANLFCITPTHFEETSLAALAACACSRPVLINDRCGIPWLEEYGAGYCVPHSGEQITTRMTEMLSNPERLRGMGMRARKLVEDHFFLPQVVNELEALYMETAS